jgi:hypothetical protein
VILLNGWHYKWNEFSYQKSLGVPSQVSGIREIAKIVIHWHRVISTPIDNMRDSKSCKKIFLFIS